MYQNLYNNLQFTNVSNKFSIFLAGPTPRDNETISWRIHFVEMLNNLGYDGLIYIPEPMSGNFEDTSFDKRVQIEWENQHMHAANLIVFWIPRDLETLPGFTTNIEFGEWMKSSDKVAVGYPAGTPKVEYITEKCITYGIPVFHTELDFAEFIISKYKAYEKQNSISTEGTDTVEDATTEQVFQNTTPSQKSYGVDVQEVIREKFRNTSQKSYGVDVQEVIREKFRNTSQIS